MLQVPHSAPRAPRFTKAQIADMARGGDLAVRVKRPKADPLIPILIKADEALERYIVAYNEHQDARDKLAVHDRGWPSVTPIDDLIPTLSHSDHFSSVEHIEKFFARRTKSLRLEIKDCRARLRRSDKKGPNWSQWRLETQQHISSNHRQIATLARFKEAQKRAFRAEERRLLKAQRVVHLQKHRDRQNAASRELRKLTQEISKATPTTKAGALALLSYVKTRCRSDLANFFVEDGIYAAGIPRLIGRARTVLARRES